MTQNRYIIPWLILFALWGTDSNAQDTNIPCEKIGVYEQEVSTIYTQKDGLPSNDVTCVSITPDGTVYAGTTNGLAVWNEEKWSTITDIPNAAVQAIIAQGDTILAVYGKELYSISSGTASKIAGLPTGTIHDLAAADSNLLYAASSDGLYRVRNNHSWLDEELHALLGENKIVYAAACNSQHSIAVAAESGLFLKHKGGKWTALYPSSKEGRSWAPRSVKSVAFDQEDRLWFASPQGVGCLDSSWTLYTGREGLPYNDFTCLRIGWKNELWFGTKIGAIRFDGNEWAYRQGHAWLPHDEVRDIAVSPEGHAWFATPAGLGLIERRPMTLAQKATFYEEEIEKYIKRTEYGYTSEVHLPNPGDKSKIIYSDSDNDGLWTSMYGAGECFAYAVTKDPQAKTRAKQAFEALRFLSAAPVGGEVKQQPGFVARTVVPTTEPDPNQRGGNTIEGMKQTRAQGDALWKVYSPRWVLTKDKKYWYKTDTSSDELDGHYFFYPLYYDLVADTPEEKERVREVVQNITDHLVRNDYRLIDHDGKPTRWAIYSPASLNHNRNWQNERGLNSLSILSYLAVAEHITGDPKYGKASLELREKHAFDTNAMVAKIQRGIGSGNQSDDEMAIMNFYNLIQYTEDEELREEMTYAFYQYWILEFQR